MKIVVPNSLIFHSDNLVEKIPGYVPHLELKTVEPYLLTKHSLPDNSASVVGISDFERRNSVGSHVACNFGLQKATSSFFSGQPHVQIQQKS